MILRLLIALLLMPSAAFAVSASVLTTLEATTERDNFNNTNNPISVSTPSGGGTWSDQVYTGSGSLQTDGASFIATAVGVDDNAYHSSLWSQNVAAMVTLNAKNTAGDGQIGIFLGLQNLGAGSANGFRGEVRIRAGAGTDEWRVQRIDAGIPTVVSSGTIQEIAAGDKIAVIRSGTTIELWWKTGSTWSLIVSYASAVEYTGGGKIGIQVNDVTDSGTAGDDLKVMNLGGQKCIGCGVDKKVIGN